MLQPNSVFGIAIIFFSGYFGAKLLRRISFPAVTAYMLAGILIGPRALSLLPESVIQWSDVISNFVLGLIAFSLGSHFTMSDLKSAGRVVLWISILEAIFAWLIVTIACLVLFMIQGMPLHPPLVLGAAAAATAPAATVMVIREYRARGPVTNTLLRVVAIDDAWCLVLSALAITAASAIHSGNFSYVTMIQALGEIIVSIILGGLMGFLLRTTSRLVSSPEELLTMTIGFIALSTGLAMRFHLSTLLTNIAFGITVANICRNRAMYFESLRRIDNIFFLSFFVLVGANLEISMIPKVGLIGIIYIIFRVVGKFLGVMLGARISKAEPVIAKYLGWGLVPQAGVALGVALTAKTMYPQYGTFIFTTITATTIIYELIGPLAAKYGLTKAGEIDR